MQNKRKICVVTGSRADYGHLRCLMEEIKSDKGLILQTIVAGSHLEKKFGHTYKEVLKDGFRIDGKVDMKISSDDDVSTAVSAGRAVQGFSKVFGRLKPDIVVLLGDRYEIFAAGMAAVICRISIAHIHGGELTQGAYDDIIRHALTKMSFLHFVCHKEYAKRVVQMGESWQRVFNYGAPGLDNLGQMRFIKKKSLEKGLGIRIDKNTAIVTFHPVTMEKGSAKRQIDELLQALASSGLNSIFTMPNADQENSVIIKSIKAFVSKNKGRAIFVASLGSEKYFSLMKHAGLMIGNSSSGVIEAASFSLPVINIGSRQKGRVMPANVISCTDRKNAISDAVKKALSADFLRSIKGMKNPFHSGNVSRRIKQQLKNSGLSRPEKGFRDIP